MAIVYMEFVVFTTNGYLADKQHSSSMIIQRSDSVFIGPESDHWLCLSLTNYLTDSCLGNLIDVTLACEDANLKLVEVVSVTDVDAEDHVGNSLLIWELMFGHKAKLLFRLSA